VRGEIAAIIVTESEGSTMPDLAIAGAGVATARPRTYHRRIPAAAYLTENWFPCAPRTLAKFVVTGGGPPYRKAGPFPLYDQADLDAWARSKIGPLVRSSSEARSIAQTAAVA
jgi:hypothetical protein